MRCDKLSGVFYNDAFRYKETIFIAKGHLDVKINTIMIQVGIKFEQQQFGDELRYLPYLDTVDVETDIDRYDINIQIYGNIWSDFASLFEVFFVGTVADAIDTGITAALTTTTPTLLNAAIEANNGYIYMTPNWWVDWQMAHAVEVTNTYLGAGVMGMFFD